jgi:hypothetical protein
MDFTTGLRTDSNLPSGISQRIERKQRLRFKPERRLFPEAKRRSIFQGNNLNDAASMCRASNHGASPGTCCADDDFSARAMAREIQFMAAETRIALLSLS